MSIGYYRDRSGSLFENLVGTTQKRQWCRVSPTSHGGFEVDDQFDFRGLLDGQVGGLDANISPYSGEIEKCRKPLDRT
jgi:hypothetical protein